MIKVNRIGIIGGSGYIGSSLAKTLRGDFSVKIIDTETSDNWVSNRDKRYLKEVQTVSMMVKTTLASFPGWILRKYGLLRLLGILRGIHLFDLDTSVARFAKYGGRRKKMEK